MFPLFQMILVSIYMVQCISESVIFGNFLNNFVDIWVREICIRIIWTWFYYLLWRIISLLCQSASISQYLRTTVLRLPLSSWIIILVLLNMLINLSVNDLIKVWECANTPILLFISNENWWIVVLLNCFWMSLRVNQILVILILISIT